MKKILRSLLLVSVLGTCSANASFVGGKVSDLCDNVKGHKLAYSVGAPAVAIAAAVVYDLLENDAALLKTIKRLSAKGFGKTKEGAINHPIITAAVLSALVASGVISWDLLRDESSLNALYEKIFSKKDEDGSKEEEKITEEEVTGPVTRARAKRAEKVTFAEEAKEDDPEVLVKE